MFLKHTKWAMLWALLMLILCGIPGKDIPHISFLELLSFDKFVHAGIFFVLQLLTVRGFILQSTFPKLKKLAKFIALLICIVYGGALEIMQGTFFTDRSADIFDFIANTFGASMGWILYDWMENKYLIKLIK
jgi:VanZ family protein